MKKSLSLSFSLLILAASTVIETFAFSSLAPSSTKPATLPQPRLRNNIAAKRGISSTRINDRNHLSTLYIANVLLPIVYSSSAGKLLHHAIVQSATKTTKIEKTVLVTTAAMILCQLLPTDYRYWASSKRALQNSTPHPQSKRAKARRYAAVTFRSAVRIKILGQLVGLATIVIAATTANMQQIMKSCTTLRLANIAFFAVNGGTNFHDSKGILAPMKKERIRVMVSMDIVLALAAFLAASSSSWPTTTSSMRHGSIVFATIYSIGTGILAFQGMIGILLFGRNNRNTGKT